MSGFVNQLNLPEFKIISIEENGDDVLFNVEPINPNTNCPECGSSDTVLYGSYNRFVRDLNSFEKRVAIRIFSSKHKCKNCGHHFVEEYKSIESQRRITKRLKEKIRKDALHRKFTSIANEYGITVPTVKSIFIDYVKEEDAKRILLAPKVLGIDEAHIKKSSCATFVDVENSQLLEMIIGNKKKDVIKVLDSFKDPENIEVVTMDMYRGYREAVKECLPDAFIVVDRFHVIKAINKLLDDFRKSFFSSSVSAASRNHLPSGLNNKAIRACLLSDADNLTAKQINNLDTLFKEYPIFEKAYRLKEEFRSIYDCTDKADAIDAYTEWAKKIKTEFPEYLPLTKTVKNWGTEIFNYFEHRYTNGRVERLNGKIKEIYRAGRGYSFDVLRFKVLYSTLASKKPAFSYNKSGKISTSSAYVSTFTVFRTDEKKLISGSRVNIDELYDIVGRGEF